MYLFCYNHLASVEAENSKGTSIRTTKKEKKTEQQKSKEQSKQQQKQML